MSRATEDIFTSALNLPEPLRLELAAALLESSEPPVPEPRGDAWLAELQRRSAEIDAGLVECTPWAEVQRRIRERVESQAGG